MSRPVYEVAAATSQSRFRNGRALIDVGKFTLVLATITLVIWRGTERLGYNWQWYRLPRYLYSFEDGAFIPGPLLMGLGVTLEVTAYSLVLALAFGLATALLRLSASLLGRTLARFYLETVRNTPLLIQLFFIYFVIGPILDISAFASAVLALSLFEGAYASEMFRSGILAIGTGQWEAAFSLGMNRPQAYRYIILPQALRQILPMLTGQAVTLLKDSALVSTVAIYDLTMRGMDTISETYLTFEVLFTVAGVYLIFTVGIAQLGRLFEARLRPE